MVTRGVIVVAALAALGADALAQSVTLSARSREIYAELPFLLTVEAQGFDQDPQPDISGLEIGGADVKLIDVTPAMQQSIIEVNGRRTQRTIVTYNYTYRVTVPTSGTYEVSAVTVTQGAKSASTQPASFSANEITPSTDMKFRVSVPARAVWVGETFELQLDWYLRRDPKNPSFVVPLFESDQVEVNAPRDGKGDGVLEFFAGTRDIELPYTRSTEKLDGADYTRLRFRAMVTPMRPGTIEMPAAKVVSSLVAASGFRRRQLGIFKAEDEPRTLEIRALPLKGRPSSFANAVGSAFSIDVQASRTVVQVGDPVELKINIRGDGPLEGVSLPDLTADGGLSPERFDIPADQAPGMIADAGGKMFVVTVRLQSADVTEIPPLAFSYFDPKTSEYQTVRSQPIALSVAGSAVVGARDVVGAGRKEQPGTEAETEAGPVSLVGADLALSSVSDTLDRPLSAARARPVLIAMYALPLMLLGFRLWRVRTSDRRAESGELRDRVREVRRHLDVAASAPGLQVAPKLVAALKALGKTTGAEPPADILEELETQAYNPTSAKEPLSEELRGRIAKATDRMQRGSSSGPARRAAGSAVAGLLLLVLAGVSAAGPGEVSGARDTYAAAIEQTDRDARTRGFAQAELAFREIVSRHPDRPELLADWGNAALGAEDLGRATLAFRRALYHDSSLTRARKNLTWVRKRAPSWLATPQSSGAIDSLFFWHTSLTRGQRHIAAALAFMIFVLLVTPWGRRARLLRRLAVLPLAVFIAMIVSVVVERDQSRDAVVVADGVVLRSADSVGAPPALANPLPAGAEGVILETRESWARIGLADGTRGWVPGGVVERVASAE